MIKTISGSEQQMIKQQQQAGVVSIIVATMLIIIVSLIVIAFSQVSRREQRESLDAQLSTQAYYAAETGINAATAVVQANPAGLTNQPNCRPASGPFSNITYVLNATSNVEITCLLVDPAPTNLQYTLSSGSASVIPILPEGGAKIAKLTFTWPKSPGQNQSYATCTSTQAGGAWKLPPEDAWGCPYAAIRADLVSGDGGLSRTSLLNNDVVSLLLPVVSGSGSGNPNSVSPATCDDSNCSVTFSFPNYGSMYLRLSSMYRDGETVTITGTDGTSALKFTGAQAKIDATGRAQDVLRRIVVSAPILNVTNTAPMQALVSGDSVCKRFSAFTGYYQIDPVDPSYQCN